MGRRYAVASPVFFNVGDEAVFFIIIILVTLKGVLIKGQQKYVKKNPACRQWEK